MADDEDILTNLTTTIPLTSDIKSSDILETFNLTSPSPDDITANASTTNVFVSNRTLDEVPFYLNFRDEPWVIPLVTISLFNVASILIFEIYVLYKSCGGRRHLFMGQILLLGLFMCSVLALLHVPQPHWLFCGITRAGVGIAYSIVFGTLLVKCVFLLKIHNGVYFNASFQALLLFFIVAVEIAIVAQWLVYEPPNITSISTFGKVSMVCEKSPLEKVEYLTYVMLLLFLVVVASIRGRSLRENHRESLYIGLAIAVALVLWVAWIAVAIIFDRRYEAPAEAFGLVCTALLVFFLIFVPKAAHLANPRGNLAHSSSHSVIHTPSFLHLQPHAVLPNSANGTLVKQSQMNGSDYCRGSGYSSRIWRYDYPSFHQMEPPAITNSDLNSNSMKKGSSYHSHLY